MDLGIQHSLGSAAIHDLEDIQNRRCVECIRRGGDPDEDVELEYLERLVREVSIGVNQVEFNMENLALLTGNTFTRPPRPDSPIFYGVCRAASASDTSVDRQEGWAMYNLGYYPLERGINRRYHQRRFLFAGIPGSRDSSASPPPIPRVVSSSRTTDSLPDLISDGVLGDVNSDVESPPSFFKSPETRRWVEIQEQEAVALCTTNLRAPGSCPTYQDADEEPPSSSGGGERRSLPGDGDLEVGVGSGAGSLGPRCVGVPGVCVPPTDDEVELLLFFALSSRPPSSPVLE